VEMKFSAGLWIFGSSADRFVASGYRKPTSTDERIRLASKVKDLQGVDIHYPSDFKEKDVGRLKDLLKACKLRVGTVCVDLFSEARWMNGALTSPDEAVRSEAVKIAKTSIKLAKDLGTDQVAMWLGQDGYDYTFQVDYGVSWDRLVEAVKECGRYDPSVKIGLEYKIKEPRTHIFISTVGKALLLVNEVGLKNVGVIIDVGHALMAFENPAESVVLLAKHNKLFHLHLNDNYGDWDHDMIVGTVHLWELVEMLFWLQEVGYDGWYGLDIYPYREDPVQACNQSIENIKLAAKFIERVGADRLRQLIRKADIARTIGTLRKEMSRHL